MTNDIDSDQVILLRRKSLEAMREVTGLHRKELRSDQYRLGGLSLISTATSAALVATATENPFTGDAKLDAFMYMVLCGLAIVTGRAATIAGRDVKATDDLTHNLNERLARASALGRVTPSAADRVPAAKPDGGK
jgi:hypothetical protein